MGNQILGVGLTGKALTELEREILRESPPYAVVLFGRNIESVGQLSELVGEIKSQSETPPLMMIDQEGGRVDRLRDLVPGMPSAESFGEGSDAVGLSEWFGRITGRALRYFDIEVNLAPVVDIRREESVKGLERRCFGTNPKEVVELAGAFIRGQQSAGVASCIKHFPGLGMGSGDSHYGASVVDLPFETLLNEDLVPYIELGNLAGAVMIGHAVYPRIAKADVPASLNRAIATRLLRETVGFRGLAVSDDMEMHAVADLGSYEEICARALEAGNDVILLCSHVEMVPNLLADLERRAAEREETGARFQEAVGRAGDFRAHCGEIRERATIRAGSFDEILAEVEEFCEAFRDSRPKNSDGSGSPPADRRQIPRTSGTGRTGREEWT